MAFQLDITILKNFSYLIYFRNHVHEFCEIDGTVAIFVNFTDQIYEVFICYVLTKGSKCSTKLLSDDGSIAVLIEEREYLAESCNLFIGKVLAIVKLWLNLGQLGGVLVHL